MQIINYWLFALIVYPFLEECIFRYGLLNYLDKKYKHRKIINNIIISLVFSALHFIRYDFLHSALIFIPSFILGVIWQKKQKLWLCYLVHALFNFIYCILMIL